MTAFEVGSFAHGPEDCPRCGREAAVVFGGGSGTADTAGLLDGSVERVCHDGTAAYVHTGIASPKPIPKERAARAIARQLENDRGRLDSEEAAARFRSHASALERLAADGDVEGIRETILEAMADCYRLDWAAYGGEVVPRGGGHEDEEP